MYQTKKYNNCIRLAQTKLINHLEINPIEQYYPFIKYVKQIIIKLIYNLITEKDIVFISYICLVIFISVIISLPWKCLSYSSTSVHISSKYLNNK